ncbi:MAG: Rpn family recombination-promoting nuclease/putative transposase [Lachnospiraceae bacterium]|nr:Rpn family recombination-promoting nuclease/putative transposase [Lachnospiraceae bacterium]
MKKEKEIDSVAERNGVVELPTGKLKYPLTNDFMFKAVLQRNQTALKGLLCALLHMRMEEVAKIKILNPIEIGGMIDEKMMMLDLKLELNDNRILDIEMQILDEGNWPERSLAYLCRTFDQLEKGGKYLDAKETIHIGILDFTPKDFPKKLYLDYFFYNLDTAHKYSDKVSIRVLQLNQLDNEANEKKWQELYHWARLFKAQTWEEMRMLAEKNDAIRECVFTYKELTADEMAQMQLEALDNYYRRLDWAEERGIRKGMEKGLERAQKEIARNLLSNVEHAMESFHVDLERACEGLGTTVDAYQAAKELLAQK